VKGVDLYKFHEMLVILGKKHLPQHHEVPDFFACIDRLAYQTRVLVDEFYPKNWQAPVDVTYEELIRVRGEQILDLLRCKFEFAFMSVRYAIDQDWNMQVIPAEVPSGE
jgi:hypothetical protein